MLTSYCSLALRVLATILDIGVGAVTAVTVIPHCTRGSEGEPVVRACIVVAAAGLAAGAETLRYVANKYEQHTNDAEHDYGAGLFHGPYTIVAEDALESQAPRSQ